MPDLQIDDDPFACFGDSDADSNASEASPACGASAIASSGFGGNVSSIPRRDPECGVLAFHAGTEQALLAHVQRQWTKHQTTGRPESILRAIDSFCLERHWMMHCGPQKAAILRDFVAQCAVACRCSDASNRSLTIIELGTYCGYSSIMLCHALQQMEDAPSFHIYTVEVNLEHSNVAETLLQMAGLNTVVTVLRLNDAMQASKSASHSMVELVESQLSQSTGHRGTIDFLFLDHDKDAYLDDLRQLERAGLIRRGTHVAADNVVFAQIEAYRNYVSALANRGIVETRLVEAPLEYSAPDAAREEANATKLHDGIELTIYLKDAAP